MLVLVLVLVLVEWGECWSCAWGGEGLGCGLTAWCA